MPTTDGTIAFPVSAVALWPLTIIRKSFTNTMGIVSYLLACYIMHTTYLD